MDQIYLTVPQAAEALALSAPYLYKEIQAGRIPGAKKFGKAVRLHRETLEQWAREDAKREEEGG